MRRRRAGARAIAALVVIALLLGVGIVATGTLTGGARAKGLAPAFGRISGEYRLQTEQFILDSSQLDQSDLSATLRLFGGMLDAAEKAKKEYARLKVPSEMETVHSRLVEAVEGQVTSLRSAIRAARTRDDKSVVQATERFVQASLGFEGARLQMQQLIDQCGARCA